MSIHILLFKYISSVSTFPLGKIGDCLTVLNVQILQKRRKMCVFIYKTIFKDTTVLFLFTAVRIRQRPQSAFSKFLIRKKKNYGSKTLRKFSNICLPSRAIADKSKKTSMPSVATIKAMAAYPTAVDSVLTSFALVFFRTCMKTKLDFSVQLKQRVSSFQ